MENSKSCNQAIIPYPHNDHGRYSEIEVAMIMSTDSRIAGGVTRDGNGSGNRLDAREASKTIRTGRRENMTTRTRRRGSFATLPYLLLLIASLCIVPVSAVLVDFQNCLSEAVKKNKPLALQFVPLFVDAIFNTTDPNHPLTITVWGNVTGSTVGSEARLIVPPGNDTEYWNSNATYAGGKIVDIPDPTATNPKLTTLSNKVNVLTYEPWSGDYDFCNSLINGSCPLAPRFDVNA